MAQREDNMVCGICGKENPAKHQDFCRDLGCSGRLVLPGGSSRLPGRVIFLDGEPPHGPLAKRAGLKYIDTVPEGDYCRSMLAFKGTMYVATRKGVYKMVDDKLVPLQFVIKEGE